MTDRNRIWVLGAPDPEMNVIESLLRECGERVEYALSDRGARVTPATAYRCPAPQVPAGSTVYAVECIDVLPDGWVRIDHHRPGDPGFGRPPHEFFAASSIGQVVAELARLGKLPTGPRVSSYQWVGDREGAARARSQWFSWEVEKRTAFDGGARIEEFRAPYRIAPVNGYYVTVEHVSGILEFAASPDEMREAGALRVGPDKLVRVHIPHELVLTAAADHCLGAAYAGKCPGVDPDALMRWRVTQRATHQGRAAEQILEDIERARECLAEADTVELAPGVRVADVRGYCLVTHDCGHKELLHEDYTSHISHKHGCPGGRSPAEWCNGWTVAPGIPELPDAASRDAVAYIATVADGGGRQKVVLGGCTTPEMVRAFLEDWAPRQGLVDCYGDPARGFAGGYVA